MNLDEILQAFKNGALAAEEVKRKFFEEQLSEMADVVLDLNRQDRCGLPEVVYGHAKTAEQIIVAVEGLLASSAPVLVTRLSPDKAELVQKVIPGCHYCHQAEALYQFPESEKSGLVLIVTAGTSDVKVAREAELVCRMFGLDTILKPDVGVAALQRILNLKEELLQADCIIVCAGMEAALPSVVGGLVSVPVIGVPISSGYGSSLGGFTALLGMLNSCSSGLCVVNIDNGFGAGYAAGRILKSKHNR